MVKSIISVGIVYFHESAFFWLKLLYFLGYCIAKKLGRKCAREAMVTAQARLPERQMTEILAEEEGETFLYVLARVHVS